MRESRVGRGLVAVFLLLSILHPAIAFTETLTSQREQSTRCGGVFRQWDIINGDLSSIQTKFTRAKTDVSIIVYNWADRGAIGYLPPGEQNIQYICDANAVTDGVCSREEIGSFVLNRTVKTSAPVHTAVFKFKSDPENVRVPQTYRYWVNETGFYCVAAISTSDDFDQDSEGFEASAWFRNPYGELPGVEYAKLPFYGVMSIAYLVIGMTWLVASLMHWREILPIQNHLSLVIFFIMLENAFTYGYYDFYNTNGVPSNFLLIVVVLLSAGRNTLSLFILLIVSLGYGVVKPTLGSTMKRCIGLAWVHFVFGNLYIAGQMVGGDINLFNVMFFVLPLSLALTVFYVWTISALNQTIKVLELRRQIHKLAMYRSLYRLILTALAGLGVYFIATTLFFRGHSDQGWLPAHWRERWFWLEGYLNVEFALVFWTVLFLWRPTANNSRYGLLLSSSDEDDDMDPDDVEAEAGIGLGPGGATKRDGRRRGDSEDDRHVAESGSGEDVLAWAEKNIGLHSETGNGVAKEEEKLEEPAEDDVEAKLIQGEQGKIQ